MKKVKTSEIRRIYNNYLIGKNFEVNDIIRSLNISLVGKSKEYYQVRSRISSFINRGVSNGNIGYRDENINCVYKKISNIDKPTRPKIFSYDLLKSIFNQLPHNQYFLIEDFVKFVSEKNNNQLDTSDYKKTKSRLSAFICYCVTTKNAEKSDVKINRNHQYKKIKDFDDISIIESNEIIEPIIDADVNVEKNIEVKDDIQETDDININLLQIGESIISVIESLKTENDSLKTENTLRFEKEVNRLFQENLELKTTKEQLDKELYETKINYKNLQNKINMMNINSDKDDSKLIKRNEELILKNAELVAKNNDLTEKLKNKHKVFKLDDLIELKKNLRRA